MIQADDGELDGVERQDASIVTRFPTQRHNHKRK